MGTIGRAAAAQGTRVLHLSTDYVFDGRMTRPYREDDEPRPLGAYGRSKHAGELALAASGCRWTLVRTQWLYGGGPSFVRTMWSKARRGERARVVNDQFGAPTHTAELADVLWRLVREGADGIWHAAAEGCTTWYEVAQRVYRSVGADSSLVTPCTTKEYGAAAPRPANGCLDTSKLGRMRPFHEVLTAALHTDRCGITGP
ncbi:MAG: SDR family oxidoreductase [Gemmatimonadaceae bacterium]